MQFSGIIMLWYFYCCIIMADDPLDPPNKQNRNEPFFSYVEADNIDENLLCPICTFPLLSPVEALCCGSCFWWDSVKLFERKTNNHNKMKETLRFFSIFILWFCLTFCFIWKTMFIFAFILSSLEWQQRLFPRGVGRKHDIWLPSVQHKRLQCSAFTSPKYYNSSSWCIISVLCEQNDWV